MVTCLLDKDPPTTRVIFLEKRRRFQIKPKTLNDNRSKNYDLQHMLLTVR